MGDQPPDSAFPGDGRIRRRDDRREGFHDAFGRHCQRFMGMLNHEHVGDIAEVVVALAQILRLGHDIQTAVLQPLGSGIARQQIEFVVGKGCRLRIAVVGFMDDAVSHGLASLAIIEKWGVVGTRAR